MKQHANKYEEAAAFFMDDSQFLQLQKPKDPPRNAWHDLKSRTISHSDSISVTSDMGSRGQATISKSQEDGATTTTTTSTKWSASPTITQDIANLQKNIRKLSFRSKLAELETSETQLTIYNSMNSFNGAIWAF
jgi:hypothetical protein